MRDDEFNAIFKRQADSSLQRRTTHFLTQHEATLSSMPLPLFPLEDDYDLLNQKLLREHNAAVGGATPLGASVFTIGATRTSHRRYTTNWQNREKLMSALLKNLQRRLFVAETVVRESGRLIQGQHQGTKFQPSQPPGGSSSSPLPLTFPPLGLPSGCGPALLTNAPIGCLAVFEASLQKKAARSASSF